MSLARQSAVHSTTLRRLPAANAPRVRRRRGVGRTSQIHRAIFEGLEARQLMSVDLVTSPTGGVGTPGSLPYEVANASPGDVIQFNVSSPVTVTSPVEISNNLTISGPGASSLTISGGNTNSIFTIDPGVTVSISGLTITGGSNVGGYGGDISNAGTLNISSSVVSGGAAEFGAGIYNSGMLTVSGSTISGNSGSFGGGIENDNTATLSNTTITGNSGDGGAVFNNGVLSIIGGSISSNISNSEGAGITNEGLVSISDATISNNTTTGSDGGGLSNYGDATITNSTFCNNAAVGGIGGGVYNGFSLTVMGSTFSANSAGTGGGIFNDNSSTAVLVNSTFAGNQATASGGAIDTSGSVSATNTTIAYNIAPTGGGISIDGGDTSLYNTIVAFNKISSSSSTPSDIFGNLDASLAPGQNASSNNAIGSAGLNLGPLASNGGPTQTIALLQGSTAAIDQGSPSLAVDADGHLLVTDQRGYYRVYQGVSSDTVDIGAYEYNSVGAPAALVVNSSADTVQYTAGYLTLRQAVGFANFNATPSPISFSISGPIVLTNGTLELTNLVAPITIQNTTLPTVTVNGNDATELFSVDSAVTATISGLTLTGGSTGSDTSDDAGGGVLNNGTLTVSDSTLTGDSAAYGGGINNHGVLNVNSTYFINDTATYGSAINNDGTLTVTGGSFSGGSSTEGGAITNNSNASINGSTFSDNSATDGGGAINNNSSITLTNVTINSGTATFGGALDNFGAAVIVNSTLSGNSAMGGAIFNSGTVDITGSSISNNVAVGAGGGGGVYNIGSLIVGSSVFSGNSAAGTGGAGISNFGVASVDGSIFDNNTSTGGIGGGIYNDGALTLTNSTFYGNSAQRGGGIDNDGSATVINSTFAGNPASGLAGNSAVGHGGAIDSDGGLILTNSTIVGNSAGAGGGVAIDGSGNTSIYNSIVSSNSATTGNDVYGTLDANLAAGQAASSNNLISGTNLLLSPLQYNGGPMLINNTVPMLTIAPLPGSPAIDAGNNALAVDANNMALQTDQRGVGFPRIVGAAVDIGSVEIGGYLITPVVGSTPQSEAVGHGFANPLAVTITAVNGFDPVNNGVISFSAPGSGASANLSATSEIISGGMASVTATANGQTGSYSVSASASGHFGTFSLTNTPLVATSLAFIEQPTTTVAGKTISTVEVEVEDQFGNLLATDNSDVVSISINSGPSTSLNGTLNETVVDGIATFSNLSINTAGTYTLGAADAALTPAVSNPFVITAAAAEQLAFIQQPTNAIAGNTISPAVTVAVEDQYGNIVTTDNSSVLIGVNTGPSSLLNGTLSETAHNGIATFADLSLNIAGTYTLVAADGSLNHAISNPFAISAAAAEQLAFIQQPTSSIAGNTISPAVTVAVEDQYGNIVTTDNSSVTIGVNTGPSLVLHGTLSETAVNGIATFANLSLNTAGTYTLAATDGSLNHAFSNPFTITAAAAEQLAFIQQPSNTIAGNTISPAVTVAVEDQYGNIVTTDNSSVTIAVNTGPSTSLNGTLSESAVNGIATFANLSLNTAGTYTLVAADGSLNHAFSNPFTVTAAAAEQLVYIQQPSNTIAGTFINPAVTVAVEDQYGNVVLTDNSSVTMAINTGPSSTLNGTLSETAHNGIATFADLSINTAGTYTLVAADGSLNHAFSNPFVVSAAAAEQLVYVQQPTNAIAGVAISPAVTVAVEDQFGNLVTTDNSSVTIGVNTGPNFTLHGTLSETAVNGIATFANLSLNTAGTYTLAATDGSLNHAFSNPFTITAAAAEQLAFVQQPTNTIAGNTISPAVTVAVEDQFGNLVTTDNSFVNIAVNSGPSSSLNGTLIEQAQNGIATFSNLSLNAAGTYTLVAADASLNHAISNPFAITAAAAEQLVYLQQPTNAAAGAFISPAVTVAVEDQFGNLVTTDNSSVSIAVNTGPNSSLNGTLSEQAHSGIATFSDLSLDTVGTYTLVAADGSLSHAISNPFAISAAAAEQLVYLQQPTNAQSGDKLDPPVTLAVEDQFGNLVTTDSSFVTIAVNTGPSNTLNGTLSEQASGGIATFSNLSLNTAGTYTLVGTDGSLNQAVSNPFVIKALSDAQQHIDLFVTKSVNNSTPNVGTNVLYTVTVTGEPGTGYVTATNVMLTDLLPSGETFVSGSPSQGTYNPTSGIWTIGSIPVGTTVTLSYTATINQFSTQTNTAAITAADETDLGTQLSASVTVNPQEIDLAVTKSVNSSTPNVGANVTYTVTASNATGFSTATDVLLTDLLPAGETLVSATPSVGTYNPTTGIWTLGTLSAGSNATLTVTATVNAFSQQTNTAAISGADQTDIGTQLSASATINPQEIDLSVAKSVNNSTPNVGSNVIYTVTVNNAANYSTATDVMLKDLLPAGETLVSATPSIGTYNPTTGIWTLGTLSAGSSAILSYTATVNAFASQTNTAAITGADQTEVGTQLSASVTVNPQEIDLNVVKTVNNSTPNVGTTVTYTVTVSNATGYSAATDVLLKDLLPSGETLVSATPSVGAYNPTTGIWTLGTLSAGSSATLSYTATVNAYAPQTNTATITGADQTEIGTQLSSSVTVNPQEVDLSVTKTVNNSTPNVGSCITYTVTASNATGYSTATDVVLKDLLPSGETLGTVTPSVGTYNATTGIWSIPSLAAGASATLTYTATVNQFAAQTNTATITGADQTEAGTQLSASVTVNPQEVDLSVTKTVSNSTPQLGTSVMYTVTVNNAANYSTATDVVLKDLLPSGETLGTVSPSVGTYNATTGIWSIPSLSAGSSAILTYTATVNQFAAQTNTATITGADQTEAGTQLSASVTVNPQEIDLNVTKTVNCSTPNVGTNVTYTVTVSNATGYSNATNVFLADLLPSSETLVSSTVSQGSYNPVTGQWTVGALNAGGTATLTVTATVTAAAFPSVTNTATASSPGETDFNTNPTASVIVNPVEIDLNVTDTVNNATPNVGSNVTYTIAVSNGSGYSKATSVMLSDLFASSETIVSATPSQGTYNSATGVWSVGTINGGANATLTVVVTATAAAFPSVTNTATVTSAQQPDLNANPKASVTVSPQEIDLSVLKTESTTQICPGHDVIYTVTLSNAAGYSTATGVSVTDMLPTGLTLVSAVPSQGTYNSSTGIWSPGSLAGGASATLTVTALTTCDGVFVNTAQISATGEPNIGTQTQSSSSVTLIVGAALNGEVWNDLNGNGLIDAGEPGIANITVELLDTKNVVVATTTTNSSGIYAFNGVAPGNYTVEFFTPNGYEFTTPNVGNNPAINSAAIPTSSNNNCFNNNCDNNGCGNNNNNGCNYSYTYCGQQYSGCSSYTSCGSGYCYSACGGSCSYEFCDSNKSCSNNNNPGANTGTACVTLVCGTTDSNVNAGMYQSCSISSCCYFDQTGCGLFNCNQLGVCGVTVDLLACDGKTVLQQCQTSSNGDYCFNNVAPGQYCVKFVAPCGEDFSTQCVGSNNACNSQANPCTGKTNTFCLTGGQTDKDENCGLFNPASVSGYAYVDYNNNGVFGSGDSGLSGITIELMSNSGQVIQTTTTACDGAYNFTNVAPGTYSVYEPQAQADLNGYTLGKDSAGTVGNSTDGTVQANGVIGNISLNSGANASNYNFGESAYGQTLLTGDSASIAFWAGASGQKLLTSLNGGSTSTTLGNWLATNYSNLYGKNCGTYNMTNKTNSQIGSLFQSLCNNYNTQLNAQVMACAFNCYVTNSTLCGTVATAYGFNVMVGGCGTLEFNTWAYGQAAGTTNFTDDTVNQIIAYCNTKAVNGSLFGGNSNLQAQACSLFTAINQAGNIGADA